MCLYTTVGQEWGGVRDGGIEYDLECPSSDRKDNRGKLLKLEKTGQNQFPDLKTLTNRRHHGVASSKWSEREGKHLEDDN